MTNGANASYVNVDLAAYVLYMRVNSHVIYIHYIYIIYMYFLIPVQLEKVLYALNAEHIYIYVLYIEYISFILLAL